MQKRDAEGCFDAPYNDTGTVRGLLNKYNDSLNSGGSMRGLEPST